jgi:O-antigen/teichoic acid export membrane protein
LKTPEFFYMLSQQLNRLGKTSFIYSLGGMLGGVLNFVLLPVFTAYLTPADYGIISLLNVLSLFLVPVLSLGFTAAIGLCYFEGNDPLRKQQTIGTAALILSIVLAVVLLPGASLSGEISAWLLKTSEYRPLVLITLATVAFTILAQPFMLSMQMQERAKSFAALSVGSTVINLASSLFFVIALKRGVRGMVEGTLLAQGTVAALFALLTIRKDPLRVDAQIGRELFKLGLPLVPAFASLYVLNQENRFWLQRIVGIDAVGIFTIGTNLGMFMNLFVGGFTTAWMPYFMSFIDKREEAEVVFGKVLTYYVIGFGTISLLFFIFAKPIVMFMTHPAFHRAYVAVGFSAGAQFFLGVFSILTTGIYFAKETRFVTYIQGLAALVSLPLNYALVSFFGVAGASLGMLLNIVLLVVALSAWNKLRGDQYLSVQYEKARIVKFFCIASGIAAFTLLAPTFSRPQELLASFAEAFVTMGLMFYQLVPAERQAILSKLPKTRS